MRDAIGFIAELRQTVDLSTLPVGRHVVVIGGGMTAVDAACSRSSWGRGRGDGLTGGDATA